MSLSKRKGFRRREAPRLMPRGVAVQFDRLEPCGLCGTSPLSYVDP